MSLFLHSNVDIRSFKQMLCFVKKLFLDNLVGLDCVLMITKTLSKCNKSVPPCSQLRTGGHKWHHLCTRPALQWDKVTVGDQLYRGLIVRAYTALGSTFRGGYLTTSADWGLLGCRVSKKMFLN